MAAGNGGVPAWGAVAVSEPKRRIDWRWEAIGWGVLVVTAAVVIGVIVLVAD